MPAAALNALHAANGVAVVQTFPRFGNIQILRLPANLPVEKALGIYRNNPQVQYAEPDYVYRSTQTQTLPNDTSFTQLWGMHNTGQTGGSADADIDAPEAWSLRTDASSVIVGVIDTGIDYNHPDLAPNVWVNTAEIPNNGIDDDGNGYIDDVYGINSITNTGNPMDDMATTYHGTHVSGTIGGAGNNALGVAGVAWNVRLMGLKFLDSAGSGSSSNAIKCIDYAIAKGAHILSNSWGGGGFSQALYDAINRARAAGILFVAAAGNSNVDTDSTTFYPSGYKLSNVVAVASTDYRDSRSSFSNYGYATVHLGAPGSSIYSTMAGGGYQSLSGTSMATPHVSGALALIKAHFPAYTTDELIRRLLTSTDAISSMNATTISGGRLNIYKALAGVERVLPHLVASPRAGIPGLTVTFTDDSIGDITSRTLDFGDGSAPVDLNGSTTHTYANLGTYTATLTVTSPLGTATRTQTVTVSYTYNVSSAAYQWVDTTGMASVALTDDSVSAAIALPFSFPFYGTNYGTLYVGSNGLLTFGSSAGATSYSNTTLPSTATPNAAIYALWDDLDPAGVATAAIRYGATQDGNFVVSWEGVPAYGNPTYPMTFQVVLTPAGLITLQYQEVQAANTIFGGGRSATVGVENASGLIGKQYSYNGSPLLANNTAIRFTWPAGSAPAAPTGLSATPVSGTQINLAWTDNATNETGFTVERSTDNATFAPIAQVAAGVAYYQNTGLSAGVTYYYRVAAFNAGGNSAYSNTVSAKVQAPPSAPSGLAAAVASGTQLNVSWTDTSTDETAFHLERGTDGVNFVQLVQLAAGVTSYPNTGLTAGVTYYYRVHALNSIGDSAYSNIANATPPAPPAAPTGLTATVASATQINLAWVDNTAVETGYRVLRSADGVTFTQIAQLGANVVSYQNTGLTAGTTYYYRVVAYNLGGESAFAAANATTGSAPPAAPTSLTAKALSTATVRLTWVDVATNETAYIVERLSGKTYVVIANLGANITTWDDTGRSAGTKYTYRVKARNASGDSAYSNTVNVTTPRK